MQWLADVCKHLLQYTLIMTNLHATDCQASLFASAANTRQHAMQILLDSWLKAPFCAAQATAASSYVSSSSHGFS